MKTGFIGTGAITEAMITGLMEEGGGCRGPLPGGPLLVTRRNRQRSTRLAETYRGVEIADDPAEIVARCDLVVIAVLPGQAEDLLQTLSFGSGQTVASVVAGLTLSRLQPLVSPARDVCRFIPMPPVEYGLGPIPVYPACSRLQRLLGGLGTWLCLDRETDFDALSASSALMATCFQLMATQAHWTAGQGVDAGVAAAYTTSLWQALTTQADRLGPAHLAGLAEECLTPGGLNEQVIMALRQAGWFAGLEGELDKVADRVRQGVR